MKKYYLGSKGFFVYAYSKLEAIGKFYSILNFKMRKSQIADNIREGLK
jgi:hypothetical protein